MSCTLYWGYKIEKSIDYDLQKILEKRWQISNGHQLDNHDIPFLEGLDAAGVDGARKLIEAIEKHGEIFLDWKC